MTLFSTHLITALNPRRRGWGAVVVAGGLILGVAGCGAKGKETAERRRKEAALLVAEANFAINLRDWARAESLLTKSTVIDPDTGAYWTSLGAMRIRLSNKSGARQAYLAALKAYEKEAAEDKADAEPWLKQVYVLALLGRVGDGRSMLERINKQFPGNRKVRAFIEGKQFDRMLADPVFKESAL